MIEKGREGNINIAVTPACICRAWHCVIECSTNVTGTVGIYRGFNTRSTFSHERTRRKACLHGWIFLSPNTRLETMTVLISAITAQLPRHMTKLTILSISSNHLTTDFYVYKNPILSRCSHWDSICGPNFPSLQPLLFLFSTETAFSLGVMRFL